MIQYKKIENKKSLKSIKLSIKEYLKQNGLHFKYFFELLHRREHR